MKKGRRSLRSLRADLEPKVTQSEMARRVSKHLPGTRTISLQRYWQIEVGEGKAADEDEQAAVAAVLGVKVSEIEWPDVSKAKAS